MSGLRVSVWRQEFSHLTRTGESVERERFFCHWTSGGTVIAPCSESDGFLTPAAAHRAVEQVWRAFGKAHGLTADQRKPVPYTRDSLKP